MEEFRLDKLNRLRFEKRSFDKAILVTGATEVHGYHLPFATDTMVAYMLAEQVCAQFDDVLLLPPLHFGMSENLMGYPCTVTLSSETLVLVVEEILDSIIKNGLNKILIINGHGGNIPSLQFALRNVKKKSPGALVALFDAWWVAAAEMLSPDTFAGDRGLGHAGEGETSIGLKLFPELVDMDAATASEFSFDSHILISRNYREITPSGALGNPNPATCAKGEKMLNVLVDYLVKIIKEKF